LLEIWHTYRTPILLSTVILLMTLRIILHARARRERLSESPIPGSPQLAKGKHDLSVAETRPLAPDDGLVKGGPTMEKRIVLTSKVRQKASPKRVTGGRPSKQSARSESSFDVSAGNIQPLVFFASLTGGTQKFAEKFVENINAEQEDGKDSNILPANLLDLSYIELDDYFITAPKSSPDASHFYIILLPTYDIDSIVTNFLEHLRETHHDFRIDTAPLSGLLGYSVFGFGDKEGWPTEAEGFCSQAKEVDKWMAKLTSKKRAFPLGMGDVKSDANDRLSEWRHGLQTVLSDLSSGKGLGEGIPGSGDAVESDEEDEDARKPSNLDDLEDLGKSYRSTSTTTNGPLPIDFTTYNSPAAAKPSAKEMVPKESPTYAALTKQGYKIIGSHSGVKLCRWTKSALRGRGSCYKYTFYGIQSHLCMETTPSLSCSNKCVFCWRHGTNPVSTTWRWTVDDPVMIFEGAKEGHYKMIKTMRGVPGVRSERFAEAMRVRHCALSLVGEPIFYPRINEFVDLLHQEQISSFLVCNAQHPEQLERLKQVTQLYVSIDASNKESLRRIDRPLHRDYWERFMRCLDILREKRSRQRTVFRLTLVKGFNIEDEIDGYADLVTRGLPCFVEIKGVTYCGTSTSSKAGLTMQNVPFYEEICTFVTALDEALKKRGLEYGIAAEHAHSCCVLLASTAFKRDGKWCTRIDYGKFFELLESGQEFGPEDYIGEPTPEWALWGNGGFDPRDEKVDRKGRKKVVAEA